MDDFAFNGSEGAVQETLRLIRQCDFALDQQAAELANLARQQEQAKAARVALAEEAKLLRKEFFGDDVPFQAGPPPDARATGFGADVAQMELVSESNTVNTGAPSPIILKGKNEQFNE